MKRHRIIPLLAAVLLALGLWWLLRAPQPKSSPQVVAESGAFTSPAADVPVDSVPKTESELRQKAVAMIEGVFNTPIEFYGLVVDQNGDPVPDAHVGIGVNNNFNASGSNYSTTSDKDGYFTFNGARGASMGVNVRKDGYYQIHKVSNQSFAYGMGPDGAHQAPPTRDNPAIFVLHRMGTTEPLVRAAQSAPVPKDGTPVTVDLMTGRLSPNGNLRVEAWTEAPEGGRKFSWRCQVTVPGGGLAERTGQFEFEAPEDGYEESVELGMGQDAEQWTSDQQRDYFVKLPDGRFARVKFRMIAGGNHYFVMESFLNPTPGSRNLEYNPKQASGIQ
jgi:hypothetical protein